MSDDPLLDHDNLEEFADAENYDVEDDSDTGVAFYAGLAQESGGPVLEIACGTGRVSLPIARLGYHVTGLDIVPGMLAQARRKSGDLPVRWVEADARAFDLGAVFRLIFLTGNAFQMFLTRADQEALLARVGEHLEGDGLFAFETRNPRWVNSAPRAQEETHQGAFFDLETRSEATLARTYVDADGHEVSIWDSQRYDHVAQVLHLAGHRRWRVDGQEVTKVTRIALRYTFPQELDALLHYNGFEVIRRYGDWNLEPLGAASPSIIVVCRKARVKGD